MNLTMSFTSGVIWLFFRPGSRARVAFKPNQDNWLGLSLPINDWRWCFLLLTINTMTRKTSRLSKLDASVLEAQMRCGTEWPIGLVDAIAEAHRTTVQNVMERQRVLRSIETHDHKLNVYFWDYFSISMSLLGFKISASGITSIPSTNSLALHLYKTFGERQLDASKLQDPKIADKVMPSTTKKKFDNKIPASLKAK